MTEPAPLLEVEDVELRFGGVTALDGVTFDVRPSELFAIIGPNGAGKTSIFNCLNSVYRPTSGHIRFAGVDLDGVTRKREDRLPFVLAEDRAQQQPAKEELKSGPSCAHGRPL